MNCFREFTSFINYAISKPQEGIKEPLMKRIKHTSKLPGNKKDLGNDMTASKLTFMHTLYRGL